MDLIVEDDDEIVKIATALAVKMRVKILRGISCEYKNITALSEELKSTKSNVSSHVALLEEIGLIESKYEPGIKGVKKSIKSKYDRIIIILRDPSCSFKEANENR